MVKGRVDLLSPINKSIGVSQNGDFWEFEK